MKLAWTKACDAKNNRAVLFGGFYPNSVSAPNWIKHYTTDLLITYPGNGIDEITDETLERVYLWNAWGDFV